jgi:hypothetical protein
MFDDFHRYLQGQITRPPIWYKSGEGRYHQVRSIATKVNSVALWYYYVTSTQTRGLDQHCENPSAEASSGNIYNKFTGSRLHLSHPPPPHTHQPETVAVEDESINVQVFCKAHPADVGDVSSHAHHSAVIVPLLGLELYWNLQP